VLVLLTVAIVVLIVILIAADRTVKAIKRIRGRREANRRLIAAAAVAEAKLSQRKAAVEVSGALTSVIPAIHDLETRHVS
jgi:hypothetical protein